MSFRLHGEDGTVIPKMFAKWLECDCEIMLNNLVNFNQSNTWNEL